MNNLTLSLNDIASWSDESIRPTNPENGRASIPALQRGLVWSPKQIELLWDSLMRGIPVGSFVLCRHIQAQATSKTDDAQYHLLDGQQRANAIYLGFASFPPQSDSDSILWIDLDPGSLHNTTRSYLIRVTTPAHPWGYGREDNATRLGVARIRSGLNDYQLYPGQEGYVRPVPKHIQPVEANIPVPLSLVLSAYKDNVGEFRQAVKEAVATAAAGEMVLPWMNKAIVKLEDPAFSLDKIHRGVQNARAATIVALLAPDELIAESDQERGAGGSTDITNIEHLFQRLNQQGTRLDGEELSYSLIKAYWPELAVNVDSIARHRMPASRLVSLAVRVVLSENQGKLAGALSVSSIRKIAHEAHNGQLKEKIREYIQGVGNDGLEAGCRRIDQWLGVGREWGLLPVLRTGIAHRHQDLYLLLLILARKHVHEASAELSRLIAGLTTLSAWFGAGREIELADCLLSNLQAGLTEQSLAKAAGAAKRYMHAVHSPIQLDEFIRLPALGDRFGEWRWWGLVESDDRQEHVKLAKNWWQLTCIVRDRRELLLYAQRNFLRKAYPDYDPARKDLWESQNRPWDYDHILPSAYTFNVKSKNTYLALCKEWCNTNGNLRAWPFEDNRSDQKTPARNKLNDQKYHDSFIAPEERSGFDQERGVLSDPESLAKFMAACKSRIIHIYEEWYNNLGIGKLLQEELCMPEKQ